MLAVLGPLTCDQEALPTLVEFAAVVMVPTEVQIDWFEPAFAAVGGALDVMVTLLVLAAQEPFVMVQRKT